MKHRAVIVFGNNNFGAIPPGGTNIKATYRVGGGQQGNVPACAIQTIVDAPQLALLGAEVTNPKAGTGGADRESVEHAVFHAPAIFRSQERAVTAEDYKALALEFKGVGKVRAKAASWNTVKLFVAPAGGGQTSDVLKQNLLAYFEDLRQISTQIEIEDVDYVDIYVSATIKVESYYPEEDVEEKVKQGVGSLLAFDNVDFGQKIYLSKFYEAIEDIDGVAYVNISEFRHKNQKPEELISADIPIDREGKIELKPDELPVIPEEAAYVDGIKLTLERGK